MAKKKKTQKKKAGKKTKKKVAKKAQKKTKKKAKKKAKKKQGAEKARKIAAEAKDVRQRVRNAFVETVRKRKLDLDQLGKLAEQMVDGTVAGLKKVVPDRRESVLRGVVDGLGDGFSATAQATRLALEEARGRGETFTRGELKKAARDLEALQSMFNDTVSRLARKGGETLSGQIKGLGDHAARTAERIRPSIQSALSEAVKHPVQLAGETATAGLKAAPRAAGMLLKSASGLLQGAADLLAPQEDKKKAR